jgi:RNA polymerase primary sigma factor
MTHKDSIEYYRSVAKNFPPLKREDETKLLKRVKRGDKQARELLVKHNLNLIIMLAKKQEKTGLALEDLVQEGMAGFVHAIDKFDLKKEVKLSTYAVWWVNAFIFRHARSARGPVKLPNKRKDGELPPFPRSVSMSSPIGENDDGEFLDLFADESPLIDEQYDRETASGGIRSSLKKMGSLGSIGRDIVYERLMAEEPMTLDEIGKRHGLSRERIRQLEVGVKDKLRKRLMDYAA